MNPPSSPSSTITAPPDCHETSRRWAKLIVEAMTCRFTLLHYDGASRSMIEWCWPADGDGERVPPSSLEKYREGHKLRYPCCLCADGGGRKAYVEAALYSWWNEVDKNTNWIVRCTSDKCGYQVRIDIHFRVSSLATFQYPQRGLNTFHLSTLLGDKFMDAYVGLIASQKLQTEIYVLSYLLKDRVYPGDLWELVGERSIEAMQEETLRRHQDICNVSGDGTRHAAVERFLMEERKKRCQMEVSLYSQAIEVVEQCRMPYIEAPAKHEIKTPSASSRHGGTPPRCLPLPCVPLACSISTRAKCEAWLKRNDAYLDPTVLSLPLEGSPPLRIGPSLPLLSTWITADVQEAFYEAFQTEIDMQSELMTKSHATRRSNANLRNHGLDLLILQAKMHRAQTEITMYTLALENTHAIDFSDHTDALEGSQTSWDHYILRPILSNELRYCDMDADDDTDQSHDDFEFW
ncbi:hypothetical protein F4604DRAFT_1675451 [Suillus subluteus]|nr:hypothetical protein F4604DRAFT_1675451 [Suillus subluteus]